MYKRQVHYHDQSEKIWVPVQGEHNVFNALIAIAVGLELDISCLLYTSLENFQKGEVIVDGQAISSLNKKQMSDIQKEMGDVYKRQYFK